jgi:hypothetical protein
MERRRITDRRTKTDRMLMTDRRTPTVRRVMRDMEHSNRQEDQHDRQILRRTGGG